MSGKIILAVKNETGVEEEFVFQERTSWLVGRAFECQWRLPHPNISRRHCLLDIDPPFVNIRDLGSLNGTFVNGERIEADYSGYDLADGDDVQIGSTELSVHMEELTGVLGVLEDFQELEAAGV